VTKTSSQELSLDPTSISTVEMKVADTLWFWKNLWRNGLGVAMRGTGLVPVSVYETDASDG